MSEESVGTTTEQAAAEPGTEQTAAEQVNWKERAEKAESSQKELQGKWDNLSTWYQERPNLHKALDAYDTDENLRKFFDSYNQNGSIPTNTEAPEDDSAAAAQLPPEIVEQIKTLQNQVAYLSQANANSEVDRLSGQFNKEKGYPFNFSEEREKVAEILKRGDATTLQAAINQYVGQRYLEFKSQADKEVTNWKRKASMPRVQTPSSVPLKAPGEKAKGFAELFDYFEEQKAGG